MEFSSVAQFLATWYGPADRPSTVPAGAEALPPPLQAWYAAAGSYTRPVTFHNTVLAPDEVEEDDGKLVFWLEQQGVYEWATDPGDDPRVYERQPIDGEPWHPSGVRLSEFLISVAVFEAVMGAEHTAHAAELTGDRRDALLAPMRALPMPGPTLGAQLYAGPGLLAFTGPHGDGELWWAYLAATDPERLEYARPLAGDR